MAIVNWVEDRSTWMNWHQTAGFQKQDFSCSGGPKWDPPVTFELNVIEQNQLGFWNILIRPTSGASFIKIGRPTFSTSGTLSQTMTFNNLDRSVVTGKSQTSAYRIDLAIARSIRQGLSLRFSRNDLTFGY